MFHGELSGPVTQKAASTYYQVAGLSALSATSPKSWYALHHCYPVDISTLLNISSGQRDTDLDRRDTDSAISYIAVRWIHGGLLQSRFARSSAYRGLPQGWTLNELLPLKFEAV